ncbi:hypothetical protein SHKM778_52980 [Streptomyces sp. KM77-8]|uniref:Plastocyanin-like domain-containing protein n=1 Tax=Streptomyces haneummycinicus TaxID=3074435 RepID=A0AAT9HPB5_9ACTN
MVNGAPWPVHEVEAVRHRLRLLNASNARHYRLEAVTDDGRRLGLVQIGADQGLLAAPVTHTSLPVAPSERYDVIIDFGACRPAAGCACGTGSAADAPARSWRSGSPARRPTTAPSPGALRGPAHLAALAGDGGPGVHLPRRPYRAGARLVHRGQPFDPARTDVRTRLGAVEVWRLRADAHHPVHLHQTGFRVLSRDGGPPLPYDAGLKDTVSLRPGRRRRSSPASTVTGAASSSTATMPSTRTWG